MSKLHDLATAKEILRAINWSTTIGVELEFAIPRLPMNKAAWYTDHPVLNEIADIEPKWKPQIEALIVPENYVAGEIASPVYDGSAEPKILEVANLLKTYGAIAINGAGLHVHAGMDDIPYQQWGAVERQMFANYVLIEPSLLFSYDRMHDEHAGRRTLRTGFNEGSYAEYMECAQNLLNGPIGHMNLVSRHTKAIFPLRHEKPYRTLEWKAPQATFCPIQIASNMLLWHDLYAFSAKKALSIQPKALPQGGEFSELMNIARTYNNNMQKSDSFDIDDRVRLLTWDVDALETHNRI